MAKPVGALCNLECTYCYYRNKLSMYGNNPYLMEAGVLEQYIKKYIRSQASPVVVFSWQGGEPCLAGPGFFEEAVFYQKKYAGNRKIENVIQTNGTLLDDTWCSFLKKHRFLVGISIDGPREIHDFHRVGTFGSPSWEKVMKGINLLRDHDVPFNTLTAINSHSVKFPLEIYNFFKGIGSKYQQYAPVVERQPDRRSPSTPALSPPFEQEASLTSWSVPAEKYGIFLIRLFDEWVRKDVGSVFIQMFEASLASWLGEDPGICLYRKYCGNALVMEQNGDIYACDHFVFPEYYRGNIMDSSLEKSALSESQGRFGFDKYDRLPEQCLACDYLFACHGECPKNRFIPTPEEGKKLNYLCNGLLSYYHHIAPYMDFMVSEIRNGRSILGVKKFKPSQVLKIKRPPDSHF